MSTELSTVIHRAVYKKEFTEGNRKSRGFCGKIELITLSYQQYPQVYPQCLWKASCIKLYKR